MLSDSIKKGIERAPHRSLLRATGVKEEDFAKPFIGVCNSYLDLIPGHVHLQEFGRKVKQAIREAGGVPFEFNTIGVDDGIAMGHIGMRYSLPSRELIADSVETVAAAHCLDGMVCIPNCDKIVPGMLMAAARLNIPTVFLSGGPMAAGRKANGEKIDLITIFEAVGSRQSGTMSDAELEELEKNGCPGCGSCAGMFTANSMNCLLEALGMALPGNGTILAIDPKRDQLIAAAGRTIMNLVQKNIKPRDIMTSKSFTNALILDLAMGGSTNTILHTLAVAQEAGVVVDLKSLNGLADRVPYLCKVSPALRTVHVEDVDRSGGIPAILNELTKIPGLLHLDQLTVTGATLGESIKEAAIRDHEVIRSIDTPFAQTGGLALLFGNLAPEGAVIKTGAVAAHMWKFSGPAHVFDSQDQCLEAIAKNAIKAGEVVVIRYEGPKGGRACPRCSPPHPRSWAWAWANRWR